MGSQDLCTAKHMAVVHEYDPSSASYEPCICPSGAGPRPYRGAHHQALQFLDIDEDGLTKLDRKVLVHIIKDFQGGPVGLETLAAMTGEDKDTLEDFCEPYLIRLGLLQKTSRGRQISPQKIISLKQKLCGEIFETQKSLTE